MANTDERIDTYIEKSQDFAKPVMKHLRELLHRACPDINETIKWGMPFFEYKGPLANLASFKAHCSFGFWKGSLLKDENGLLSTGESEGMGHFGKITSLKDLPPDDVIVEYIREAVRLNEEQVKVPKKPKTAAKELVVPSDLLEALARDEKAAATFEAFPYSCKKEYVEWITGAKTEPTRLKRLATTIEWLAEGKRRNWKYENC